MDADDAIKNRRTQKVLANEPWKISSQSEKLSKTLIDLLDLAAHAPYHKKCDEVYTKSESGLNSCLPWRFYVLDAQNCRVLLKYIDDMDIKAGKVANMLAAADALFLVTWLPDLLDTENLTDISKNEEEAIPFEGSIRNMEHIAAASAAIQNVLIGAAARNIPNYWSSGGQLRNATLRKYLKIPMSEMLLGALFLFPEDSAQGDATIKLGAMRNQGKEKGSWSTWIDLNNF